MTDQPPVDNQSEEFRLLERRVRRLQSLLTIYRWSLGGAVGVVAILVGLLLFAKAPALGRAILINGKQMVLVRNEKAASAVRQRLLVAAGGGDGGSTFREKWEDTTRPVDGEPVLSVNDAVSALAGKVTVLKEAVAIEEGGQRLVVVPTREMALSVLDQLKARYRSPSDAVVHVTKLRPTPVVRLCAVPPAEIMTDPQRAIECLLNARSVDVYQARSGDYPERIASAHDMTLEELWSLNPGLRGQVLHPGQQMKVYVRHGGLMVVTVKETVSWIALPPPVVVQSTPTLPKGTKKVQDPGKPGRKLVRFEVTMNNDREVLRRPLKEEIVIPPRPQTVLVGSG
jgi:hypothetical protein